MLPSSLKRVWKEPLTDGQKALALALSGTVALPIGVSLFHVGQSLHIAAVGEVVMDIASCLYVVPLPLLLSGLMLGLKDWWTWDGMRSRQALLAVFVVLSVFGYCGYVVLRVFAELGPDG